MINRQLLADEESAYEAPDHLLGAGVLESILIFN